MQKGVRSKLVALRKRAPKKHAEYGLRAEDNECEGADVGDD